MIEIKGWRLENIVHFKKAEFEVKNGLHIVRGLNKNSNNKNQNNGAGKSLLFSPLANTFVFSPPVVSKKRNKKDILGEKSCSYTEFLTHDRRHVEVYQRASKYDIIEDGVDQKITLPTKAEKQIREYFPLNELEFYSTCYLTSLMPLPFQINSPSDRLKFISDLFRLHDYDLIRKHFAIKLRAVKDSETEYRTLKVELNKCVSQLEGIDWDSDKNHQLQEYEERIESLNKKIRNIQEKLLHYGKMSVVSEQIDSIKARLKKIGNIKNPKDRLSKLKQIAQQCEEYSDYERELAAYKKSVLNLQKQIDSIKCRFSVEQAQKLYDEANNECEIVRQNFEECDQQMNEYDYAVAKQDKIKKKLGDVEPDVSKYEAYKAKYYAAESILSLKKLLKHADCETVECPTCKSDFDADSLRSKVKKAEKDYEQCGEQIALIELQIEYDKIIVPEYDKKKHKQYLTELKEYEDYIAKVKEQLDLARQKQSLQETLDQTKKPTTKLEKPEYDFDDIVEQIESCKEYIKLSSELEELENKFDGDYDSKVESDLREKFEKYSETLQSIFEKSKSLENSRAEYKLVMSNKLDVEKKLADLQDLINNKRVIETLVNAYGPKGLKINAINNITRTLEMNFNQMAPFIFNENFQFELATDSTGIDVIVHRPKGYSSDVRMLSGAESNCFKMLFLTSMLPLIPNDRRVNMIVLDEPMANGDQITKEKFITDFVPYLRTVIPSIYILTPDDDNYDEATNWLVTKEKGESKVTLDYKYETN